MPPLITRDLLCSLTVLLLLVMDSGCGYRQEIPGFTTAPGPLAIASSDGWNGIQTLDPTGAGAVNLVQNTTHLAGASCTTSTSGFTTSGCSSGGAIAFNGSRWMIGFAQNIHPTNPLTDFVYGLSQISDVTGIFGGSSGASYLNPLSTAAQAVTRYLNMASLDSGKVVATYLVTDSSGASPQSTAYGAVYDPQTQSWTRQILGAAADSVYEGAVAAQMAREISLEGYDSTSLMNTVNMCRPKVASSGNAAMVVFCGQRAVGAGYASYLRYARYVEGSGWLSADGVESSSPLMAVASSAIPLASTHMNANTLQTQVLAGVARRLPVRAFEPNSTFLLSEGAANQPVSVYHPVPEHTGAGAAMTLSQGGGATYNAKAIGANGRLFYMAQNHSTLGTDSRLLIQNLGMCMNPESNVASYDVGFQMYMGNNTEMGAVHFSSGQMFAALSRSGTWELNIWNGVYDPVALTGLSSGTIADCTTPRGCAVSTSAECDANIGGGSSCQSCSTPIQVSYGSDRILAVWSTTDRLYVGVQPSGNTDALRIDVFSPVPSTSGSTPTASYSITIDGIADPGYGATDYQTLPFATLYTDDRRMYVGLNDRVYVWNQIPRATSSCDLTAGTCTYSHTLTFTHSAATVPMVEAVQSDGMKLYVTWRASKDNAAANRYLSVWRELPLSDRAASDTLATSTADLTEQLGTARALDSSDDAVHSLAWSKNVPSDWPNTSGYGAVPRSTDQLHIRFRGKTVYIRNLPYDPFFGNRCTTLQLVAQAINANPEMASLGLKATLPSEWGEPTCNTDRGEGQYFYLTYNEDFSASKQIQVANLSSTNGEGIEIDVLPYASNSATTARKRFFESGCYTAIGASQVCDTGTAHTLMDRALATSGQRPLANLQLSQYIVGRIHDDTTSSSVSSSLNGFPVLGTSLSEMSPLTHSSGQIASAELSSTSFIDVAGLGNGQFAVIQSTRSKMHSPLNLLAAIAASASGRLSPRVATYSAGTFSNLLANPRGLLATFFNGTDWIRSYDNDVNDDGTLDANAVPRWLEAGPSQPFGVIPSTGSIQASPLGVRWPRLLGSSGGNGLILFYARDGARSYSSSSVSVVNRLWMATVGTDSVGAGLSLTAPSVIGPDDRRSNGSVQSDLDVCETVAPFGGAGASPSLGTASSACLVGRDQTTAQDSLLYSHDVNPIPGAMNASGEAAIGFHRLDTQSGTSQGIGFYVARYGPLTGLSTFVRIDDGNGITMGGSLSIDGSGNAVAVWEQRKLISRSSGTKAENHIYLSYSRAGSSAWASPVQVDSSSLTSYGNTAFTYAPEAPQSPQVSLGSSGKAMVSWSGPSCNTSTSYSCRRRLQSRLYQVPL